MKFTEKEKNELYSKVLKKVHETYDDVHKKLLIDVKSGITEGAIRTETGEIVETIVQTILRIISEFTGKTIDSRVGSNDYMTYEFTHKGKKYSQNNIQVDRHNYCDGVLNSVIENKTYLDACYLKRALEDFRKIAKVLHNTGKDPSNIKYIIFAGQDSVSQKTREALEADFWDETLHLLPEGKEAEVKIFFFLKGKRNSKKPLYKIKHEMNDNTIIEFTNYITSFI